MLPWAKCIRRLPHSSTEIYLTFDDGPDPGCTPVVLDLLAMHQAKATFFVIGQRAERHPELIERMISEGHQIGNHSCDHNTWRYFTSPSGMQRWLTESEERLQNITGRPSVGFRSPAGVRTPLLYVTLAQMRLPWLHWSMRFYDTVRGWPLAQAEASAARVQPGEIILLHDTHKDQQRDAFLRSLDCFMKVTAERALSCAPIDAHAARVVSGYL